MIDFYPSYFEKFKCIADKCPDSCCKGWDVVVDDESAEIYRSIGGFGEKITASMTIDSDGDCVFVNKNGRCPFWGKNGLCEIYIKLGEKYLCKTCRQFPRLEQQYDRFTEHLLSFACPEAARLMLDSENAYDNFVCASDSELIEKSSSFMRLLLIARSTTVSFLNEKKLDFFDRLKLCLGYNKAVQAFIDKETDAVEFKPESVLISPSGRHSCNAVFKLHRELEIMSEEWKTVLGKAEKSDFANPSPILSDMLEQLGLYYIYRYYLTSLDSRNVLITIKRLVCACIVLSRALNVWEKSPAELFCLYSKEVEHSYENSEAMELEFLTSPDFSADTLVECLDTQFGQKSSYK